MIPKPISTEIDTNGFKAIKIPDSPSSIVPFAVYPEDGSGFYVATDLAGSDAVLFGSDTPRPAWSAKPESDGTIFYAKGTTTTNLIVVRWRP